MRNCKITGRTNLLCLKLRPDTPQRYSNILIENITVSGSGRILQVNPWLQFFDLKGLPAPTRTIENVTIRNVTGSYRAFGSLHGNDGDTLKDITLENISLKLDEPQLSVGHVQDLVFQNVTVNGSATAVPAESAR